jgi:PAS domain S-box-containing protein
MEIPDKLCGIRRVGQETESLWIPPLWGMLTGFAFFLLGSLSDFWFERHVANLAIALIDDALVGIGAGLLVFLYERRQRRNIAERVKAESAVREGEERFRLVANTAPVLIWMSGPDKLCNYFNGPWLEFTGRPLEKELGNGWVEGVHPEDLEICLKTYTTAFDRREPFRMKYRLRRHDGEYRWVLDQGVPRLNVDHSLAGYIGSCIDITEQKLAEDVLSTVNRKLIQAHEEERTEIARELHDDTNQQIALLAINLDGLKHHLPDSAVELRKEVGAAYEQARELGSNVQALSHRLHSSKLDVLGLALAAAGFCRELVDRRGVEIEFHSENVPKELPQDISICLFRVLQEALQNAIKHSGSRVFQVRLKGGTNEIELMVRDSGIGFEPGEAIKGHGLGLTSMKERLKLVAGQLSIESKLQSGTSIYARVPVDSKTMSVGASR